MSYLLEHEGEFNRLELQSKQAHYSLVEELKYLKLEDGMSVLDAGCGSGLLSRHILSRNNDIFVSACDFSDVRLKQAREHARKLGYDQIYFFKSNLTAIDLSDSSLDRVICRYVYEYLEDPIQVTKEFYRILKPGGMAYLIDLDGVFANLWSSNSRLNNLLGVFIKDIGADLFVGKKLPSFLDQAGFLKIDWNATVHSFRTHRELKEEYQNTVDRFKLAKEHFSKESFIKVFGSENTFNEFKKLYLDMMGKQGSSLYFNKFIAWGTKCDK